MKRGFERAAVLRKEEKELQAEIQKIRDTWTHDRDHKSNSSPRMISGIFVASWPSIPVRKSTRPDAEKLRVLEDELHKRVVGQNQAVTAVSKAIGAAGSDSKIKAPRPDPIFLGTHRCRQDELAKALAEVFGDETR